MKKRPPRLLRDNFEATDMLLVEFYGAQVLGRVWAVVGEHGFIVLAFFAGLGDERLPCLAAASHHSLWEILRKTPQDFCKAVRASVSECWGLGFPAGLMLYSWSQGR